MPVPLFEPVGTPDAKAMPVRTKRPQMTIARALFIKLMQQYSELAYRMTLLEIQKMAYFLQESGEKLRLNYEEGIYGPYAHNLNKVLEILEGHFKADHVHILISIPPKYSVAQVVGYIKGKSAIYIARTFGDNKRNFTGKSFWARGYFVSTVGADEVAVREYIKKHEREDKRIEQLQLFK